MPRRRVPRRVSPRALGTETEQVVRRSDGEWHMRRLSGATAHKTYSCPGCYRSVLAGTPHVVAWPVEKPLLASRSIDERRHWHTSCWERTLLR